MSAKIVGMRRLLVKPGAITVLISSLLVIALLTFLHYQSPDISNSIDGSWTYTLSTLRDSAQDLGSNIFYTYGPLFERLPVYPLISDSPGTYVIGVILFTFLAAGSVYTIIRFLKNFSSNQQVRRVQLTTVTFLVFFIASPSLIDSLFFILLICGLLTIRKEHTSLRKIIIVSFLVLFSLYKVSFSVALITTLPFAFLPNSLELTVWKKRIVEYITSLLIFACLFCITAWTSPVSFISYLYIGTLNSAAYSEFMSLTYATNMNVVALYTVMLLASAFTAIATLTKKYLQGSIALIQLLEYLIFFVIIFLSTFLAYKQAVVRSDSHLLTFMPFLLLLIFSFLWSAYNLLSPSAIGLEKKILVPTFTIAIIVSVAVLHTVTPNVTTRSYFNEKISTLYKSILDNPLNYHSFVKVGRDTAIQMKPREASTKQLRVYIHENGYDSKEVLFFGNTTSLADTLANKSITHLPFIQNYAAFPPAFFDKLYIKTLRDNPNSLIFLDENEPSINERIPSHELSGFFQYVAHNYELLYSNTSTRQYLLQRISSNQERCSPISQTKIPKEGGFVLPDYKSEKNEYMKMRVEFRRDVPEELISLFFKSPVYGLDIYTTQGGELSRRTTPSTLTHGVAISPLFLSYTDVVNNTPIDTERLNISGALRQHSGDNVLFESCSF